MSIELGDQNAAIHVRYQHCLKMK